MIRGLIYALLTLVSALLIYQLTMSAPLKSVTVVAFGDSTTAGNPGFQSPAEVPPFGFGDEKSQYAYWLEKSRPEWRVLNRGVGGERTDEIAARFEKDVKAAKPKAVIVLAGVNDLYQGRAVSWIQKHLTDIYDAADKNGIRVVAASVMPYNFMSAEVRERMQELNQWIRETARGRGYGFCDLYAALEHPDRPGQLMSSADGLHPDVEGYLLMANALLPVLDQTLSS